MADSSPPSTTDKSPAPDSTGLGRARQSKGARRFEGKGFYRPTSTGAAEARRRAGRGHVCPSRAFRRGAVVPNNLRNPFVAKAIRRRPRLPICESAAPPVAARPPPPDPICGSGAAWPGAASVDGTGVGRYLVDPASSHMLVSRIKPCMSKYKHLYRETANGSLKQLWFIWWFLCYLDNRSNSRANTCTRGRLRKPRAY